MRKVGILAAVLMLLPLVGTVALSDFNYIGQGGGGLSESDVQTLIDTSISSAGLPWAPNYANSVGCDPDDADPVYKHRPDSTFGQAVRVIRIIAIMLEQPCLAI